MRSALLCVLFAFIVHKDGSWAADEDFKPTPIPLEEWDGSTKGAATGDAGTLQEAIGTDTPPAAAAVPAHYWEDALRHSVYLTLVRDKIDQLIGKGSGIPPDNRPGGDQTQKDDHDLWEKIKTAPFDRLNVEEPAILGDITIMSKGRLLEEKNGLRFTEDEISTEKCNEDKCNEGVRAYWSVKRIRQRDAETVPGKYHYELTFSVSSQTPKKQKRPYENPVRTFTVKEGTPVEKPQYRYREPIHPPRPQRAVWFHKNIVPTPPRHVIHEDGFDRLFSSWFLDDEPPAPKRYKQVTYAPPTYPPHSKVGHVGAPTEQYHQKHGQAPYPYKPPIASGNTHKYPRPPLGPPIGPPVGPSLGQPPVSHTQQHYLDLDTYHNPPQFTPPTPPDNKYLSSAVVKTTKPAVLPTPPISYAPMNITMDLSQSANVTEATTTTRDSDIVTGYTIYSKPRPPPTKMSYFPEHVRPPVFNAPPGVFVTMDKKPFKPMPPLKHMHSFKHNKNRPIDFRPSPQVLDVQFSDPDPLSDAFRPIAMSYGNNATDSSEQADGEKRKPVKTKSKPPKKNNKVKPHRHTTSAPEIITANSDGLSDMDWASYLGAFAKTTPMVAHKMNMTETTTPLPTTTVLSTTVVVHTTPTTTETTTTTSRKPKRTRPPPKFTKLEKIKKHKRVTSTTTTTSTNSSTERPHHRRPTPDLLTQASSASTGSTKSGWQPVNNTQNDTAPTTPMSVNETTTSTTSTATPEPSSTSASIAPTTYRAATTTRARTTTSTSTAAPTTTTTEKATTTTAPLSSKNRFRQSTLIIKGTSVKHDRWSSPILVDKNKTTSEKPKIAPVTNKFPRRKGSNFQGYAPTSKPEDRHREDHVDRVSVNPYLNVISLDSSTETTTEVVSTTTQMTAQPTTDDSENQNEENEFDDMNGTEEPEDEDDDDDDSIEEQEETNGDDFHETKDQNEFIFGTSSGSQRPGDRLNEVKPEVATTTETVVASMHSVAKNKTKCKKKQNNTIVSNQPVDRDDMSVAPIETTTAKLSTADFFNQIFGFTVDQNETDGNQKHSKYVDIDEDLEEFLHSINEKKDSHESNEEDYEDNKDDSENSPFNNDEENRFPRSADADSSEEDYQDRPLSFLELMAME